MRSLLLPLLILSVAPTFPARAQNAAPVSNSAAPDAAAVPSEWKRHEALQIVSAHRIIGEQRALAIRLQPLELTLDIRGTWDNPFDPDDIDIWADWSSTDGRTRRVNAFWYQPFTRKLEGQNEVVTAAGAPSWKLRFTPDGNGTWSYVIHAKDRSGEKTLASQRTLSGFDNTIPPKPAPLGFIRRSAKNWRGFARENEKSFVPVGENVCWPGSRGTFEMDDWTRKLGQNGGNWMRVWMCSWWGALEWSRDGKGERRNGTYYGPGIYSLDNAWRIDTMLKNARANGISTMLCFGTYGEFTEGGFFGEGQWKANPYNIANGGPCAKPAEFWTNETARKLYRRRLRYIAARWGYDTSIFAWEFWNEANAPAAWIGEMARYLKGSGEFKTQKADPFDHLVSTSYGDDAIWKLPEIDFTMSHNYGMGNIPDHAPVNAGDALAHAKYFKPHLMAEFGLDWRKSDSEYDKTGQAVNFHNGMWAGLFAGGSGGGMLWWWDSYVEPKNLYNQFAPLRKFADAVDWNRAPWNELKADAPRSTSGVETFSDLIVPADSGWGKAAQAEFTINAAGIVGTARLPQHLYATNKPELRTTPTFHLDSPRPARFAIRVANVSDRNQIEIALDGKVASKVLLDANPPADATTKPEYESTAKSPQWGIYQAKWNRDYGIDVPAGRHTIEVRNAGGDWVELAAYIFGGARSNRYPSVHLYGLSRPREAVLWLGNAAHNWQNVLAGQTTAPLREVEIPLRGLAAGNYRVDWWDTQNGRILRSDNLKANTALLMLKVPDIAADIAAHIVAR